LPKQIFPNTVFTYNSNPAVNGNEPGVYKHDFRTMTFPFFFSLSVFHQRLIRARPDNQSGVWNSLVQLPNIGDAQPT
jgi:hypothetical protein